MVYRGALSEAIWYALLSTARRRYNFAEKHSKRNQRPQDLDLMALGEIKGIRWLLKDLEEYGIVLPSLEGRAVLNKLIADHEERCKNAYFQF